MNGTEKKKPKRLRLHVGDTWFVVLPASSVVNCMLIDEVTRKTVVLRREADLGMAAEVIATRYARVDVRFVERVP